MPSLPSSLYPPRHPPGSYVLVRSPGSSVLSNTDRIFVVLSSLIFVGSVAWVPLVYAWAWKKWRQIPKKDKRRRAACAAILLSAAAVAAAGPHRSRRVGKWLDFKRWKLWRCWLDFIAYEVVSDFDPKNSAELNGDGKGGESFDALSDQAILAIVPHGIFPFALAFAALPEASRPAFGEFRIVVATATALLPFLRTFLGWLGAIDASRPAVDRALSEGSRIGLSPGGIAEMFEGYPKPMTHPDDECAILKSRKGFIRMAVKHGIPVIPIYCFGATKMLRRLQLPPVVESVANFLRIGIVLFFGQWGLPIPFRQKLLYAMGRPIHPPDISGSVFGGRIEENEEFQRQVDTMHKRFCDELVILFDRYKESYGWDRKRLRLV